MSKRKYKSIQHPIDASGVLEAAKYGNWEDFRTNLNESDLTFDHFNELPPGRSFGVVHQIAYHGNNEARAALEVLLQMHPRVDLKMPTKQGQSAREVAIEEGADGPFLTYLDERLRIQTHHELVNKARDGKWPQFFTQLNSPDTIAVEIVNTVPAGRIWGILHQVCYWGDADVLERLETTFPTLNLELETNEEAPQLPIDIAIGRGHTEFVASLRSKTEEKKQPATTAASAASLVTAPSSAMKTPVPAAGKLCNICYMSDHDEGTVAVCCDNGHYMCQTCFAGWVESESDIESNPQSILLNGGRITCVCKKSSDCTSLAYANKLIAMVVSDELYEKYLRARDYVVGKEAVAGALSKIKGGDMDAVEQEQIRNMYRMEDGTYSAYMCSQCKFGPIDHGWCNNLQSHHGEKKQGGGNINNACPKCGWFASNISKWPRWDGKFQSASVKFAPPPVANLSVTELKMALKSRGAPCSGKKAVLQARLQALYDQEQQGVKPHNATSLFGDSDDDSD